MKAGNLCCCACLNHKSDPVKSTVFSISGFLTDFVAAHISCVDDEESVAVSVVRSAEQPRPWVMYIQKLQRKDKPVVNTL